MTLGVITYHKHDQSDSGHSTYIETPTDSFVFAKEKNGSFPHCYLDSVKAYRADGWFGRTGKIGLAIQNSTGNI